MGESYKAMALNDIRMELQTADAGRALPHLHDRAGAGHLQPPHHTVGEAALSCSLAAACISKGNAFRTSTSKLKPIRQPVSVVLSDNGVF